VALDLSAWNPLDHPRDRLGRFRDKWSLSPAAKRMFQNVMRRFAPAEFRSDNHMSAFFRPKADRRARRRSREQQASLDYYMSPTSSEGMPGWADVNSTLRAGSQDMPQIRHMDSMMEPLEDDMILSRVVGPDAFGLTPEQMAGVEEWTGKLISDKAYISTNYGSPMPMQGPHVELRILAPKGTRAIMANDGSRSVILDREQPLRITHVTEDGKGGFYVMAVAMPMRGNPEGSRALGRRLAPQEVAPAEEATPEAFQRRGLLPDGTPDPNAPPPPTPAQEEQARAERFGPDPNMQPPGNIPEWQNPDRPRRGGSEGSGDAVRDAVDNPNPWKSCAGSRPNAARAAASRRCRTGCASWSGAAPTSSANAWTGSTSWSGLSRNASRAASLNWRSGSAVCRSCVPATRRRTTRLAQQLRGTGRRT
jgi:hypothetical protein